jgi:hypothetical protein
MAGKPIGERAMTGAERVAKFRARQRAESSPATVSVRQQQAPARG